MMVIYDYILLDIARININELIMIGVDDMKLRLEGLHNTLESLLPEITLQTKEIDVLIDIYEKSVSFSLLLPPVINSISNTYIL
jgi:hypothetical protein